jgi:hypothetical protein
MEDEREEIVVNGKYKSLRWLPEIIAQGIQVYIRVG